MARPRNPKYRWVHRSDPGLITWLVPGNWKDYPPNSTSTREIHYCEGNLAISQGNPWYLLGKTPEAIGGDFQVFRKKMTESSSLGDGSHHFSTSLDPLADGMEHWIAPQVCIGPEVSAGPGWPWLSPTPSSMLQLDAYGATAIARCKPNRSQYSLSGALGELREGLPLFGVHSWRERTLNAKNAGKDYLNVEFGWLPLVRDIQSFARAVKYADSTLSRYERESGQLIHRQYSYPDEVETEYEEWPGQLPLPRLIDALDLPNCTEAVLTRNTTRTTKRWLEATFIYYLPPRGSMARDVALADKLLGINLTPEVVWQLTPWSWAVDWFSNLGDVISNMSDFWFDGLVMPYAYMMEHKTVEHQYLLTGISYKTYPGSHVFRQSFTSEVKSRRLANPFGFGLSWDGLTDRQKGIIAALSASRKK